MVPWVQLKVDPLWRSRINLEHCQIWPQFWPQILDSSSANWHVLFPVSPHSVWEQRCCTYQWARKISHVSRTELGSLIDLLWLSISPQTQEPCLKTGKIHTMSIFLLTAQWWRVSWALCTRAFLNIRGELTKPLLTKPCQGWHMHSSLHRSNNQSLQKSVNIFYLVPATAHVKESQDMWRKFCPYCSSLSYSKSAGKTS